MSNIVQLPYMRSAESDQDFRARFDRWREQKGWINDPVEPPPMEDRPAIAARFADCVLPPLFAAAMRRRA